MMIWNKTEKALNKKCLNSKIDKCRQTKKILLKLKSQTNIKNEQIFTFPISEFITKSANFLKNLKNLTLKVSRNKGII